MEHGERMGRLIADHPLLAKILIAPGLYMDLLIVFALCNRRLAIWIGISLLVMHWLIAYIMQLRFPLNEFVIALFFVNVTFLLVAAVEKISGGRWNLLPKKKGADTLNIPAYRFDSHIRPRLSSGSDFGKRKSNRSIGGVP